MSFSENWKDNIYFILVEPKEYGNIGATARAIKNMGFSKLCLVNPLVDNRRILQKDEDFRTVTSPHSSDSETSHKSSHYFVTHIKKLLENSEAQWFAKGAVDILKKASICRTFEEAISDKAIVIGTTRRIGKRRGVILSFEEGAKRILNLVHDKGEKDAFKGYNSIAIVFGREDKGLFNKEIRECGFLMTIPASKKAPSLNLAQAVMVVAYELSRMSRTTVSSSSGSDTIEIPFPKLVSHAQIDILLSRIREALKALGYIPCGDRDLEKKIMDNMGFLLKRSGLTEWELNMFHGICTRIIQKCTTVISSPTR